MIVDSISNVLMFLFQTKRLFGHPNLVLLPKSILGKDLYTFIAELLQPLVGEVREMAKDVPSMSFTMHLVDHQVRDSTRHESCHAV